MHLHTHTYVVPEDFEKIVKIGRYVGGDNWHQGQEAQKGAHQNHQILFALKKKNISRSDLTSYVVNVDLWPHLEHFEPLLHHRVLGDSIEPRRLFPDQVPDDREPVQPVCATLFDCLGDAVEEELLVRVPDAQDQFQGPGGVGRGVMIVEVSH